LKKITVIGRGTAGCISVACLANISNYHNFEIEWIYDPDISPQAVGEGTTLDVVNMLGESIGFGWPDLNTIDGNYKSGIRKIGYGKDVDYIHKFNTPDVAMHFNAVKLQDFIEQRIKENYKNITIIRDNIHNIKITSDYVIDCSGKPTDYSDFVLTKYIPVNSVHVTQCYWDRPMFDYTLTVARPYGWVWGIPLQNRCSIGYMYNDTISSLDEVKTDVCEIFEDFHLTPSFDTNSFSFKNYYKKQNFTETKCFNGNASFFLEPLEATSISTMITVARLASGYVLGIHSLSHINAVYDIKIKQIENMINMHYLAGSKYNTEFWSEATRNAQELYSTRFYDDKEFLEFYQNVKNSDNSIKNRLTSKEFLSYNNDTEYGTWSLHSWYQNIKALALEETLDSFTQR